MVVGALIALVSTGLAAGVSTAATGARPASARATGTVAEDAVLAWNGYAATALIATALQPPTVSALHLAMVHGAMYDAVNAIDRGFKPYLVSPHAHRWYSKDAAAATAAFEVLVNIVPTQQASLQALYDQTLTGIPDGAAKEGGISVGHAAAAAMIVARTDDGRFGPPGFPVGTSPGDWRPALPSFLNDPAAWVANVKPFLLNSSSQFRTDGPNELTSTRYTRDFREVKSIGSATSTTRTAEQTDIARFWADHGTALWNRMFRQISASQGLTIAENARLFAMLFLTDADALINCWNDKARHLFWRPITAIREAGSDGNSRTVADPEWLPLISTPAFPEHPSGHGCGTASIVRTLRSFFGTNDVAFSGTSTVSGTTRSFSHFSDALSEVIDARVYSGIHFRTADVAGATIGRRTTRFVQEHFFGPRDS
jgi:hypothetical protein